MLRTIFVMVGVVVAESYGHVGGWAGHLFLVVALMVAAIDLLSGRGPW
jgi:hypothetical protein